MKGALEVVVGTVLPVTSRIVTRTRRRIGPPGFALARRAAFKRQLQRLQLAGQRLSQSAPFLTPPCKNADIRTRIYQNLRRRHAYSAPILAATRSVCCSALSTSRHSSTAIEKDGRQMGRTPEEPPASVCTRETW